MAHDSHFLQRLSRASLPQAELALMLYHDADLVREIFALAALPEQIERVAVSLDRGEHGPYAVIARNGRFITCLAQNMDTGSTPMLPYTKLEQASTRIEKLRARIRLEQTLDEKQLRVRQLIRQLYRSADEVPREVIEELLPFQPILGLFFFLQALKLCERVLDLRDNLLPRTRLSVRPQDHRALQQYHQLIWASGHLVAMACADSLEWTEKFNKTLYAVPGSLSWTQVSSGFIPVMLRAIWAVARMGKPMLPNYKRAWAEANTPKSLLNSGLGLMALGFRHNKLQSEISKCLLQRPPLPDNHPTALAANPYLKAFQQIYRIVCDHYEEAPDKYPELIREFGAKLLVSFTKNCRSVDGAHSYQHLAEVPAELGLFWAVNEPLSILRNPQLLDSVMLTIPWLARCRLEELFAPRAFLVSYHGPWQPDISMEILDEQRHATPIPVRQERTPGRNDPCRCGSGKKYKKCCGP